MLASLMSRSPICSFCAFQAGDEKGLSGTSKEGKEKLDLGAADFQLGGRFPDIGSASASQESEGLIQPEEKASRRRRRRRDGNVPESYGGPAFLHGAGPSSIARSNLITDSRRGRLPFVSSRNHFRRHPPAPCTFRMHAKRLGGGHLAF